MLFSQSYVVLLWMLGGHGNKTNGPFEGTKLPFGEKNKIVYIFAPKKKNSVETCFYLFPMCCLQATQHEK